MLLITELPASLVSARPWLDRGSGRETVKGSTSPVPLLEVSDACTGVGILAMATSLAVGEPLALLDGLVKVQAISKSMQFWHRGEYSGPVWHFIRRLWQ